jgi:ABC toxin N-terminal region/Neuraminidase-like domain
MSLLTLTNPADAEDICNFDEVELRYSNPDSAANQLRPFEFVRLARFIRLWKKLGWSIEQTDQVISALYPTAQTPNDPADAVNLERLDAGFLSVVPSLGILRRVMGTLNLSLPKDLSSLLACVAPIDTYGERSFFRQMFLGPSQLDSAFADDGYGNYFSDTTQKVLGHAPALRAAFSLTASEFNEISAALAYDTNTTLTLDNISAIFRRAWLARKLKLSVREFLLLVKYTGYDPFGVPTAVSPAILRFIEFITRLRSLRIKPVEALFLIWNQDLSGKSAPAKTEITGFARSLRASLAAIEGEFARVDDPDGSIARSRMALVYGNDATDLFFGLLGNTFLTFVTYSHNEAELAQPIRDAGEGRISYDDFRKRLTFAGVLSTAIVGALKAVPGVTQDFKDAVDKLYTENQKVIGPFFDRYPELLPLHDAYVASADPVEKKRTALLDAFLPELKHRRKRQQALQSTSAEVETDIGLASSVLENPAVLHASADPTGQALDDLSGIESPGFSARYFFGASTTGNADLTRVAEALLDYAASSGNPLPGNATTPGTPISGIWSGYLEVPENGFYNIRMDTDAVTTVTLTINSAVIPLTKSGNSWSNSAPLEFAASVLYEISLTAVKVKDKLSVRWQTSGRGWEVIPAPYLYSATLINNLQRAYVNLLKAAGLAKSLKLTAFEFEQFAAAADYQIGGEGWVNRLPIDGAPDSGTSEGLLKAYAALLDFSRIKADVSPSDERLVLVLKNPAAAMADGGLLYVLTRWEKPSLDALLVHFGKTVADLAHMETLRQMYDAYAWAQTLGVPADALIEAATNEPTADVVRHLRAALRARYEPSAWLEVLRPINDDLRSLQRDALVSYVLHRMRSNPASAHIDTPDKLFEYFLMDVQMDPCMLTSRIRHALSSVQLFVDRCLMGLEPRVSPASIKTKQWEWMKRYRVWEANWLEPELRDDQSPFFKETMSELLQGDITEDKAAQALVGYLTKLEEVAKLEVCGVHYEQNGTGTSDDIAHVIGRTAGAKRRYYYRRREYGYWTSWEKINLDIEDNPVVPVVWKKRLFLFWLKLVQETIKDAPPVPTGPLANVDAGTAFPKNKPRVAVKAILTWSEFLGGKWQPSRTSDPGKPLPLFDEDWIPGMDPSEVTAYRSDLRLAALFWPSGSDPQGALRLIVSYKGWKGSSFFLYNPFSSPELRESKKEPHFSPKRSLDATTSLTVGYSDRSVTQTVLDNGIANSAIDPHHPLEGNSWEAPFFYQDARHAFYVTTDEQLVSVRHWNDLGIVVRDPKAVYALPLLVHKQDDVLVQPVPHSRQPGFGLVDPIPLERYVTEDAYVGTAIGSPGTVAYGDKNIGPSGSEYKIIQRTSVERKR